MKIIDDLTIMMPIVARDYATHRILKSMSGDDVKFQILLADGSGIDKSKEFSKNKYPKLNLKYINFGKDSTVHNWMKKMYMATQEINTPLTVIVDNDDIVSKEGMVNGVKFLMDNKDYVSFRGSLPSTTNMENHHTNPNDITDQRVFDRVSKDLSGKDSAWGDITRTDAMKRLYEILYRSKTQDVMLVFTIDAGIKLFYGKNHKDFSLPLCYHIPGDTLILNRKDWTGYKKWTEAPTIKESLGLYVSVVAAAMNKIDLVPLEIAKKQFAEFLLEDMLYGDKPYEDKKRNLTFIAIEKSIDYDELSRQII